MIEKIIEADGKHGFLRHFIHNSDEARVFQRAPRKTELE
jgi:hypothetical protein